MNFSKDELALIRAKLNNETLQLLAWGDKPVTKDDALKGNSPECVSIGDLYNLLDDLDSMRSVLQIWVDSHHMAATDFVEKYGIATFPEMLDKFTEEVERALKIVKAEKVESTPWICPSCGRDSPRNLTGTHYVCGYCDLTWSVG